jgi:peptidoglycan/LPS O-acetylase OafA/YrhL
MIWLGGGGARTLRGPMQLAQRSISLDVLRAAAVLLVLGRHMNPPPESEHWLTHAVAGVWIRGGWVGVDLFFVLSGFLIGGLLFAEHVRHGTIHVGRFLIRRGFKIYPAFYVFLALTVLYLRLRYGGYPRKTLIAGDALFIQNYAASLWHHTWSLAVEEHFYILLPALLAGLLRRHKWPAGDPFRNLPWHFLSWAVVLLSFRVINAALRPYDHQTHTFPTHLRMDSLMFGVLLAYWSVYHRERMAEFADRYRAGLIVAAVGLLGLPFVFDLDKYVFMYTAGFTCCYLGSGALLVVMVHTKLTPGRVLRGIAYLGAFSYSIYLWHLAVRLWGVPHLEQLLGIKFSFLTATAAYMAGSVLVGVGMAAAIEYPVLRIRDRLYPSRSKASPVPQETVPVAEPVPLRKAA